MKTFFFSFSNYSWVTSTNGKARTSPTRTLQKSSEPVESFYGYAKEYFDHNTQHSPDLTVDRVDFVHGVF